MASELQGALSAYHASRDGLYGVERTILLYEQIVYFLQEAKSGWDAWAFDRANDALQSAATLVMQLSATLDDRNGKQLSNVLQRYYTALAFQITGVPRQKDPISRIDSLLRQVNVVRQAWVKVGAGEVTGSHDASRIQYDACSTKIA